MKDREKMVTHPFMDKPSSRFVRIPGIILRDYLGFVEWVGVLAILFMVAVFNSRKAETAAKKRPFTPFSMPSAKQPIDYRAMAMERAEPCLAWADEELAKCIDRQLQTLAVFFAQAKAGVPAFAEESLSWSSKWRLMADMMPGTSQDRHVRYLRERFAARIFSDKELKQAMVQVVKGYLAEAASIEGIMLSKIRADIADLPSSAFPQFNDSEVLQAAFDNLLKHAAGRTQSQLQADVMLEVASTIAREVLTMVAVRLGVSAGGLSAGASTSWATFGAGLAAAVLVDWIVQKIWNWYADPVGEMSVMLNQQLDNMFCLIVCGDRQHPGLRDRLCKLHAERKAMRRQAITELIVGGNSL